jgi:hypothetical protein
MHDVRAEVSGSVAGALDPNDMIARRHVDEDVDAIYIRLSVSVVVAGSVEVHMCVSHGHSFFIENDARHFASTVRVFPVSGAADQ